MPKSSLGKIGKKFLVEPRGTHLTSQELRQLEKLQPGAIMFRKPNFLQDVDYSTWLTAYKQLLDQLRNVLDYKQLIIAMDHEGGRVIRPPEPITRFPYACYYADSVKEVAKMMAVELQSLGVNVNFAPVADIHSNPKNPVINERAFATTAQEVSSIARDFASVLQENGIAPCAKHFPGHGDTKVDAHFGLPVLEQTLDELRDRKLVPFQALIKAGVPMIMTAHILFPKIDPDNVATFSRPILKNLLRDEMGFQGVIIADALGMAAVQKMNREESVVRAVNASLDIFLVAGDNVTIDDAVEIAELLEKALEQGEVTEDTLQESEKRITKFINTLPQHTVTQLDTATLNSHHALAEKLTKRSLQSKFELSLPGFE